MKLPPLYSKRSDGKDQIWEIEVEGNKHRTHSGILDGAIVISEWTVCGGKNLGKKNETSPEEQALAEAKAKWTKKLDRKYTEKLGEKKEFKRPMLAKNWKDQKKNVEFPVWAQPKLDGIRCLISKDGAFFREGKEIVSIPHILKELESFFAAHPDVILDGELYADKYAQDFNTICSLVKREKLSQDDLDKVKNIEYHVYDCMIPGNFLDRLDFLLLNLFPLIFKTNASFEVIKLVKTYKVENEEALDTLYEEWLEEGYEGQMIRLNTSYENKRSAGLLKRKEFITEEYEIVKITEGEGNKTGLAASITLKHPDGRHFKSNVKGNFDFLKDLFDNKDSYIGEQATCQFFNYTPGGIPRFPYVIEIRNYEG